MAVPVWLDCLTTWEGYPYPAGQQRNATVQPVKPDAKAAARSPTGADLWARAGHDLRQPVQALLLLMRVLSLEHDEQRRQTIIKRMEASLSGLHEMLEVLSLLARLATSRVAPALSPCDIGQALRGVANGIEDLARQRGVELSMAPPQAMVRSDPRLLPLVLKGLLLTALNASQGGTIIAGGRSRAAQVLLEIEYSGPEPTPADLRQAFIELRRASGQTGGELGLGLGFLAELCTMLGHRLDVAPSRDGRSRLVLGLERAEKDDASRSPA